MSAPPLAMSPSTPWRVCIKRDALVLLSIHAVYLTPRTASMDRAIEGLYLSIVTRATLDRPVRVDRFTVGGPPLGASPVAGRLDAGPSYGTRRDGRPDVLLFVVERGAGLFTVGGRSVSVAAGSAAAWLPDAPQHYATCATAGHWQFRFAHAVLEGDWPAWLDWPNPLPGLAVIELQDAEVHDEALSALRRARALVGSPLPGAAQIATNLITSAILWCGTQAGVGRRLDRRVRLASDHARQNVGRRVPVAEMAEAAGLSAPAPDGVVPPVARRIAGPPRRRSATASRGSVADDRRPVCQGGGGRLRLY